jgi:hypothetical protein
MTTAAESRNALHSLLEARIDSDAAQWLSQQLNLAAEGNVQTVMTEVSRRVGRRPLVASFAERGSVRVEGVHGSMLVGDWTTDLCVRILLLAQQADCTTSANAALFEAYDRGESATRVATIRALNFVEDEDVDRGIELVMDGHRTYLYELMMAAWSNNPFSSGNVSQTIYRKAVLKAIFCDVPTDGFIGLLDRADEEMAQSMADFADERMAAGRTVPDVVWIVSAMCPRPGLVPRLLGRMEHPLPKERLVAARALSNALDPRTLSFVEERISREDDDEVRAALEAARNRIGEVGS